MSPDYARIKTVPDLLNSEPQFPDNTAEIASMAQFAFSSGESAGALREALADYPVSSTVWDGECFADDLFLDDLLEGCFTISDERFTDDYTPPQCLPYLKKVLTHPPGSVGCTEFRQAIQRELLAGESLRREFETVYRKLTELREVIDSAGVMGCQYSTRRRIDILLQIKETIDLVAQQFGAASSGIARIRRWAEEFQQSRGYAVLRDFVEHEGRLSAVQLQLQVGFDGTVRSFKIEKVSENSDNRFYRNPLSRFWSWFRLFIRGYQVSRDELVARIVEKVFDAIDERLSLMFVLIGQMECHLASLAFSEVCRENGLETCFAEFVDEREGTSATGVFNPLLLEETESIITCDVYKRLDDMILIITGPNSGGKTRLLQAIGLLQLLGQSGFAVPAQEAVLHFKNGLFASLVANQSSRQEEGRLGTELLRIRRLFERSPAGSMIILDELCSGTNPSEGEEIFLLVVSLLKELRAEVFITTHFLRFARKLADDSSRRNLAFLQVELDDDQRPTYRFVPGVATTSLAGHIAQRLGVTRDQLLALINEK